MKFLEVLNESGIFKKTIRMYPNEFRDFAKKFKQKQDSVISVDKNDKNYDEVYYGYIKGSNQALFKYIRDTSEFLADTDHNKLLSQLK